MALSLGLGLGLGAVTTSGSNGPILGSSLSSFTYDLDFVANTYKGGTQPYGNNNNDGRFFRDPSNVTATYCPDNTGLLISQAAAGLRRTNRGVFSYMSGTNSLLWNRDLTNAAWTKSASMTTAKTQTGADGVANSATLLTAGAATQTVSQSVTSTAVQRVFSVDMKRVTGTGPILLSLDGGTTTTDVSKYLTTTGYTQVSATQSNLNPVAQITISTSGDAVAVDFCQLCSTTISGLNVPTLQRYLTTTATVLNSQTRPNAATADAGPLPAVTDGFFAFYWQGRSQRPTGGFIITSDGTLDISVTATGAIKFSVGPSAKFVQTADGVWSSGLNSVNRIAGYLRSDGVLQVACNGTVATPTTGAGPDTTFTHWDLGTNGAGGNTIMGINERVAFASNMWFDDATLTSMTNGGVAIFADDFSTYANTAAMLVNWSTGGDNPVVTLGAGPTRIHVENGATTTTGPAWSGRGFTTVIGRTYFVSGNCFAINTGFLRIQAGSTLNNNDLAAFSVNSTGNFSYSFVATTTTSYITINVNNNTVGFYGEVTNLVVQT